PRSRRMPAPVRQSCAGCCSGSTSTRLLSTRLSAGSSAYAWARPMRKWLNSNRRLLRVAATLAVTGLLTAYLVWKIDITTTLDAIVHANLGYFALAVAIMLGSVWPMAWRWQQLLAARGIHDKLSWLTRAYFVAYTAGQLLPTAVGGDAVRIFETAKRHTGRGGEVAGSVLLERALGGAAT